jgi:hypothetical protein
MTISDVILHIRYTAREAGDSLGEQGTKELITLLGIAGQSSQALMFNLRYDFPTEWSAFVNGNGDFSVTLQRDYFPYIVQSAKSVSIGSLTLYASVAGKIAPLTPSSVNLHDLSASLTAGAGTVDLPYDAQVMTRVAAQQVFLVIQYRFSY